MDCTECPKFMWLLVCMEYFCDILNLASSPNLEERNSIENKALGHTMDMSFYTCFEWWEAVYSLDYEDPSFPNSKEKLGKFCGPSKNCGESLHQIIHRSVLRSASNDKDAPNHRAANPHYNEDVEDINIEDIMDRTPV